MSRLGNTIVVPVLWFLAFALALGIVAACGSGAKKAPAIPHPTTSTEDSYCLGCHRSGTGGAKVTTHPSRTGCATCHKPQL